MGYGRLNAEEALNLADAKRFLIRDEGVHVASFDDQGNFVANGHFTDQSDPFGLSEKSPFNEFIIYDDSGDPIVNIMKAHANIAGNLYERKSGFNYPPAGSFVVKNGGSVVAFINSVDFNDNAISSTLIPAGSMILTGRMFAGYDPDRSSSQGN